MRIRLPLLLPLLTGVLVAAGFLLAAATVGDAVRGVLTTVPGLTRERAVEVATRAVVLGGVLVTALAVGAMYLVARAIARPLVTMQRSARSLIEGSAVVEPETRLAEIRDLGRGVRRAGSELRERHERALRERSELTALVEAVSEGIIQLDASGRIVRANRASRDLLGLPDALIGRPVSLLFRDRRLREMVARGAAGEGIDAAELVLDERRLLVTVSPQPPVGTLLTVVDLTDLRRLEEVRRDFVANASHELKTPLTSISGYSETLLQADLPDPERREFLAIISRNARRLQRIVDDLLDLSRLETGRWEPQLEPLHILQVASDSWSAVSDRADSRGLRFETAGAGDDRVMGDRRGLEQVFANLYDNALRHTPDGGTIRVGIRPDSEPAPPVGAASIEPRGSGRPGPAGGWMVVEVADTGTGIPRDALPRIFERFYRVDPARSRAEGGTGLGLSIVKHLLETMGGDVTAESVLGKGTTIRLRLPRPH